MSDKEEIYNKGLSALAFNGGELIVQCVHGQVEVRAESCDSHTIVRFDCDDARRFFKRIHQVLGDP